MFSSDQPIFTNNRPKITAPYFVLHAGGFTMTNRMLEMFRRPGDPKDYSHMYMGAGALYTAGYFVAVANGYTDITQAAYLVPALACLGGIAGLSSQVAMKTNKNTL